MWGRRRPAAFTLCLNPSAKIRDVNVSRGLSMTLAAALTIFAIAQPPPLQPSKKKKNEDKEPITQTLPVLKDPPGAVSAETSKLVFHVSPLSGKGLLTPQTRDALNALMKLNHGAQIVKLRAFVAGTGDIRRVPAIVSEVFTEKKQPLPAVTTVQVGGLPLEGAQVVVEGVSVEKKTIHPNGLVFFSGQKAADAPSAIAQLEAAGKAVSVTSASMLQVTCFLSSLDRIQPARDAVARTFPSAVANFVQALRIGAEPFAVCEGIADRPQPGDPVNITVNAALVSTPKLVLTGAQMAFRDQDADLRLAFQRLQRALEPLGVSYKDVVFSSIYPLTKVIADRTGMIAAEFLPRQGRLPGTVQVLEGLPSLDASMAIEVITAQRN
jgi:enamine deaminase RidA (YjgF/YER057c/UK114 family)